MKKFLLGFIVLAVFLTASTGIYVGYQRAQQSNRWFISYFGEKPSPEQIMANYYKTTGDNGQLEQKAMKMSMTVVKETDEEPLPERAFLALGPMDKPTQTVGPFELEMTASFPNKFRIDGTSIVTVNYPINPMSYGGPSKTEHKIHMIRAFDGEKGWIKELTKNGYMTSDLSQSKVSELKNDLSARYLNLFTRYASVRYIGEEKREGFDRIKLIPGMDEKSFKSKKAKNFYVLEGVSIRGDLEKLFFDTEKGLLECTEITSVITDSKITTCFGDYQTVQGIKLPHKARMSGMDEDDLLMTINEITLNPTIDDNIFTKPNN